MKPNNQRGWGLTETMLTLGAMSAMALAIYAVLGPASASAQVKREQDNLRSLSGAVDKSFGLLGNFSGVSSARVLEDGLAPTRMRSGGDLRTAWGTGVGIHPYSVDGVPGNAFLVSYPLAPSAVCAGLASAMSRDAYDIRIQGRSVYAGGRLDPAIAAEQCGATDAASMEFVFFSGLVSGQAVAAAPVVLPPPPPTIVPPPGAPPIITLPTPPAVDPVAPGTPA
ncbi:MAG: type 4 pilus major pilin, partial [Stenotrophomonas sp.]